MKLIRRPNIAAGIAITADILLIAAATVLHSLRGGIEATYTYTEENTIVSSHPFDIFGIAAAVVLCIAAVMSAFIIVSAFDKNKDGRVNIPRFVGAALLLIFSMVAALVSSFTAGIIPPYSTKYYHYTDENMSITVMEEWNYLSGGVTSFFDVDKEHGTAELLRSTVISSNIDDEERYKIQWTAENRLRIDFLDGMGYKTIEFNIS